MPTKRPGHEVRANYPKNLTNFDFSAKECDLTICASISRSEGYPMLGQPRPLWGRLNPSIRARRGRSRKVTSMEGLERRLLLTLLGQQLFPSDYPWNQSILNAPVVSNSAAIISHI